MLEEGLPFDTQARKRLACVCVDEVHEMGTNRGATLESFLCKVACIGAPVVACTATASNLGALAAWLGAGLYETAECPTTVAIHLALAPPMPRRMMAPTEEVATRIWAEGGARVDERRLAVTAPADYDVGDAVVDKLCLDDPPGPVMLFVASRADARAAAVRLAERRWRESGGAQEKAACRAALELERTDVQERLATEEGLDHSEQTKLMQRHKDLQDQLQKLNPNAGALAPSH